MVYFLSFVVFCSVLLQPILADPMDEQALEREQTSNLFVLQMPSDLKYAAN